MATPVQLLQLSPTMSDGTIVKWLVKEGDKVSAGDPIAEIETDKAVMEQESFEDGTVIKLLAAEGDSVPVGTEIAVLGAEGEKYEASGGAKPAPAKQEAPKQEPAKAEAPKAEAAKPAEAPKAAPATAAAPAGGGEGGRVFASPLARKIAKEEGLDLASLSGSGPNGRIVKRDVEAAIAGGETSKAAAPAAASPSAPVPVPVAAGDEELSLGGMRKTIARRLLESRQTIPSFSVTVEVDAQPVLDAVAQLRAKDLDEKITVTHFLIKAMASTLMKHPWLRTQWGGDKMVRKAAAHISVAVAVDEGLLTPVIRNCESKGLAQIARELKELAAKARDRRLGEEDLSGGVQTLSNLGMYGVHEFDAIINPPEASILAVGAVEERPVVRDGALAIGKVFNMTLSSDHRVVDGAVAASYLKDLKAAIEEPLLILA